MTDVTLLLYLMISVGTLVFLLRLLYFLLDLSTLEMVVLVTLVIALHHHWPFKWMVYL